jgi:hypothetical protein
VSHCQQSIISGDHYQKKIYNYSIAADYSFICNELHNLYPSPDIIRQIKSRRMRWAGHVVCMGEGRNIYRVLVGKIEGKRPLERPRCRWEDVIKMDLKQIGWGGGGCGVDSRGSG